MKSGKSFQLIAKFVVLLLIFVSSCKEDTISPEISGTISGKTAESETGTVISNAGITTSPPTSSITTNSDGTFVLENVSPGNYTIFATKNGYKKGSVSIAVRESMTTQAIIQLEKNDVSNSPPNLPDNPFPSNQAMDQPVSLTLSWSASDPDQADSLSFDVVLYESGSTAVTQIVSGYTDTSATVENLKYNTIYFWQVIATDTSGVATNGNLWNFQTKNFPENPIVFASQKDGNYEVYSCNLDDDTTSIDVLQLTAGSGREWWPRISPNRDKIAFTSDILVEPQIYTMNRDGSERFKITTLAVTGFHNFGIGFCWNHDGTRIFYSHYEKLYRINVDRGDLVQIATAPPGRNFREVEASPLGDKLVVVTIGSNVYESEIYLMNTDGSNMALLVDNLPGIVESPSFSPDGNRVLYTHDISGLQVANGRQLDAHIFIKSITGLDSIDVSTEKPSGTNDRYPRFSPDGSKIIFINTNNTEASVKSVWVMDADGQNRHKLVTDADMPDWR